MKGQRVTDLSHLDYLRMEKKSVYCPTRSKGLLSYRMPAAFVLNWPGFIILRAIRDGLYEYKRKSA